MISQKLAITLLAAALLTASRGISSAPPVIVPFDSINRHIVIGAAVNGSRPLSFVLDTGDKLAIVDRDRARELGLTLSREVKVGGIGSSQMTGYVVSGGGGRVARRGLAGRRLREPYEGRLVISLQTLG